MRDRRWQRHRRSDLQLAKLNKLAYAGFMVNRPAIIGLIALTVVVITLVVGSGILKDEEVYPLPEHLVEYLLWEPDQLTAFRLEDFDRQDFDLDRLKGKWTFLFFGFTFCPDVCPVTMANLGAVFRQLESKSVQMDSLQGLFVSVDPARDTPEVLKQYVPHFNSGFVGVSGTTEELNLFTRQLGALYYIDESEIEEGEPGENYQVSHNSSIFLIDPKGRQYARFTMPHIPTEISEVFLEIVQHYESVEGKKNSWF